MAKSLPISATKSYFLPIRNILVKGMTLAAAAATSVVEFFDGAIDAVLTYTIIDGGSAYAVGDLITLVAGANGESGSRAVFRVTQIDDHSASSSVSSSPSSSTSSSVSSSTSPSSSASPSTSLSPSVSPSTSASSSISSSLSSSASPSTSLSSSPSASESVSSSISESPSTSISSSISTSPSSSISSSPSTSESPSTSISTSPSTSISTSVSTSLSSSVSSSRSTSVSSSPSASLSPSVGAGVITGVELITAGGGYETSTTYNIDETDGSGVGGSIQVDTISDLGTSIGKLQATANLSAAPILVENGILTTKGISVRISGASAKAHIIYE